MPGHITKLPPGHTNAVQVTMEWGGFLMEPTSPSETRVSGPSHASEQSPAPSPPDSLRVCVPCSGVQDGPKARGGSSLVHGADAAAAAAAALTFSCAALRDMRSRCVPWCMVVAAMGEQKLHVFAHLKDEKSCEGPAQTGFQVRAGPCRSQRRVRRNRPPRQVVPTTQELRNVTSKLRQLVSGSFMTTPTR